VQPLHQRVEPGHRHQLAVDDVSPRGQRRHDLREVAGEELVVP